MKRDDSLKKHIFVPSTLPHQCVTTLSQTWKLGQHTVSTHHWCNQPIDGETWQVGQHFEIKNKVEYSIGWFCEKNNSITHSDNIILLDLLRKSFIMFYLLFWKKKTHSLFLSLKTHILCFCHCAHWNSAQLPGPMTYRCVSKGVCGILEACTISTGTVCMIWKDIIPCILNHYYLDLEEVKIWPT